MVDPEDLYGRLTSGSSSTVRGQADTVGDAIKKVEESATRVAEAADRPTWTSAASTGYRVRTAGVSQGIQVNQVAVSGQHSPACCCGNLILKLYGPINLIGGPAGHRAAVGSYIAGDACQGASVTHSTNTRK